MMLVQAIIDMDSSWATQTADWLYQIGYMRGGKKWIALAILFNALWLALFYFRQRTSTTSWLRKDALFIGLILVGVWVLRIPTLVYSHLDVDESDWIAGAATFYTDPYFWLSVDGTTSGPLSIIPLSLIPLFGGSLSYAAVRLFALTLYVLPSLLCLYLGLRNLYNVRIADVVIIPLATIVAMAHSLSAYNGEFAIMFLTSLSLYFYSKSISGRYSTLYYWGAGFVIGMLAYSKPQAIPLGMIIALGYLWKINADKRQIKTTGAFVLGGLSPTLLVALYLTLTNLWEDFINSYILNNLFYGGVEGAFGNTYSTWKIISKTLDYVTALPEYSFWMLSGLFSFLLGITMLYSQRRMLGRELTRELAFAVVMLVVAFFCAVKPLTFFYHYQNMLIIPVAWMCGTAGACLYHLIQLPSVAATPVRPFMVRVGVPIFFIVTMGFSVIQTIHHWEAPSLLIGTEHYAPTKESEIISRFAQPNERMATWGWNTALFVDTGLLQGTRDGHTHYHMSPIKLQTYYLERYVRDLKRNKPKVVVETFQGYSALTFGADGRREFGLENYPLVYNYVKQHYELKADIDGKTRVFVRKETSS
ncbi:hypothetical protein [Telluribacter sp. SYSU D00476]|uniref:hypothetical protein n=1 Tax=Telluribacter sp. SYSU D00476 TaxID=2811430 RepID=UPI001FF4FE83|nr:hypothetical protein [Telluribacter sp. SYSU D00476]